MTTGRLTATGTLFLSSSIYEQRTSAGNLQFVLPLVQRNGLARSSVTAIWLGPDAERFMAQHRRECKAGQPLAITLDRVFCHGNELHGIVTACALAPRRWDQSCNANPTTITTTNEGITV